MAKEAPHEFPVGNVSYQPIVTEVSQSYLDYAMSVIVARALPDVRDGLKPVHRRILYAMWDMGLRASAKFRKSATVVGETLGKYHPHGDTAVYDSMVRMAQDFSLRYPMVHGQGNFGSIDGDSAAAMRYCVTGETLLATTEGFLPIASAPRTASDSASFNVLNYTGTNKRATKFFNSGKHEITRVTTAHGFSIAGSYNHPVLCWKKNDFGFPTLTWKQLQEISAGDHVILQRGHALFATQDFSFEKISLPKFPRSHEIVFPKKMTPRLAFALGALVAEGSFHQNKILFCNKDMEFYSVVKKTLLQIFKGSDVYESKIAGDCMQFDFYHKQAVEFLKAIGLTNTKADGKTIPFTVLQSTRESLRAFLQGLFEGDGSVEHHTDTRHGGASMNITYDTKSRALAEQLKTILLSFGVVTNATTQDKRSGCYRVYITGHENISAFAKNIGFFSERKNSRLALHTTIATDRMSRTDLIPELNEYLRTQYPKNSTLKRHNFDRYSHLEKNYPRIKKILSTHDISLIEWLLKHHYLFDEVTAVTHETPQTVYSIRVDAPCHSFTANGFINHNTEAKLTKLAEEEMTDIDRNTVEFMPNYDGVHKEPRVVPGRFPFLICNGTLGIAVGMATSIPPHNLTEICDAILHIIEHADCSVEDLMQFVKGPDFPTGGVAYNVKDIAAAYATGRGGIVVRAKADIEEVKGEQFRIIVSEIPYMVNKSVLVEKIAELVQEKKIDGIRDLRDESNKEGIRVVIELKKDAYPKKVLNRLYQMTQMQETFHVNMLAIVDGIQPRVLNLKMILEEYIKHRREVVKRRTAFDLAKAKAREHILEGLHIALLHIDEVIKTIKASKDREDARGALMKKFKLSEIQANAILEMRLQSLANLERLKVEMDLKETQALIKELEAILGSDKRMISIVGTEVKELREKFGDERRTAIIKSGAKEFTAEDLIPNEDTIVVITRDGYIKRMPPDTFKSQARGGKGVIGLTTKEEDVVDMLFSTTTHADVMFFTTRGRVFQLKTYDVPIASRTSKGQALVNFLQLSPGEKVSATLPMEDMKEFKYFVMSTKFGTMKKTEIKEFANVRRSGLIALKINTGDNLEWVRPSTGKDDIMIVTEQGQSIRFNEKDLRGMGRNAAGVRGMKLHKDDAVVGMDVVSTALIEKGVLEIFTVAENGLGKRTKVKEYKTQGRGGSGIKTMEVTSKTGKVVAAMIVNSTQEGDVMIVSVQGQIIRMPFGSVPTIGRATQGVRIMRFKEDGDKIASVTLI